MQTKIDIHNQEQVISAIKESIRTKEDENFFSEKVSIYMSLFYRYLQEINSKYKMVYGFYHIVALSLFPNKELLFLIFRNYPALKEDLEKLEVETYERLKEINSLTEQAITQQIELKKYNVKYAENDIHTLIVKEVNDFFISKNKGTSSVEEHIKVLKKSKKINKGIKEQYKSLIKK